MKRQAIVSYHLPTTQRGTVSLGMMVQEILACGHLGHRGTLLNVKLRITEGKARLCAECAQEERERNTAHP